MRRIKRMHKIIDKFQSTTFDSLLLSLLIAPSEKFDEIVETINREYPKVESWLRWYLRDRPATMLFECQHFKMYKAQGRDHYFKDGLQLLRALANINEIIFTAVNNGRPFDPTTGRPLDTLAGLLAADKKAKKIAAEKEKKEKKAATEKERKRKSVATQVTKSKMVQKKLKHQEDSGASKVDSDEENKDNKPKKVKYYEEDIDGSTVISDVESEAHKPKKFYRDNHDFAGVSANESEEEKPKRRSARLALETALPDKKETTGHLLPNFKWKGNSCWLDSSLQLLFQALIHRHWDFKNAAKHVTKTKFHRIFLLYLRYVSYQSADYKDSSVVELSEDHDKLISWLAEEKIGGTIKGKFNSLWQWFYDIVDEASSDIRYKGHLYFERLEVTIRICCNSISETQINHMYFDKNPKRRRSMYLTQKDYESFDRNTDTWLKHQIKFGYNLHDTRPCYRTLDGEHMCTGVNFSTTKWLSIPVIMMLSVDEECFAARHQKPLVWNFLKEIRPDGNSVTYEMKVYEYDGMNGGVGKELLNLSLGTELYGQHVNPPPGFSTSCVIYRLRQGSTGQERFFTHQVAKLHELHNISMSGMTKLQFPPVLSYKGDGLSLEGDFMATGRDHSLPPQNKPTTNETVEPDEDTYYLDIEAVLPEDVVLEDETVDAETVLPDDTILSESDSPFNCCCGAAGNGPELEAEPSEAIQCSTSKKVGFTCDFCSNGKPYATLDPPKGWRRRALKNHLLAGRGALILVGHYWYPGRILRKAKEGGVTTWIVKDTGIVDELWGDVNGRRAIQLGCWKLTINAPSEENIIEDFLEAPITEEIDEVLRCHIIILEDLLNVDLQTVDLRKYRNVPALAYAHRMEKNPKERSPGYIRGTVEHYGDLMPHKKAAIAHLFSINIPSASPGKKKALNKHP
ncbi:hypothetical protein BDQ17DRAFT_1427736 [Cyathus striatus]|nr:hypothetical protein BDQ17DRAFT_1427736 [Cyathus striatus]